MPALAFRTTMPRPDDPGVTSRVCEAIRKGHSIRATAALAGIARATLTDWLTEGRREMSEAHLHGGELGPIGLFVAQVEIAYAEMEAEKLGRIDEAGKRPQHWPANMAVLRSRNPEEWVEQRTVNIEQSTRADVAALLGAGALVGIYQLLAQVAGEKLKELPEGRDDG